MLLSLTQYAMITISFFVPLPSIVIEVHLPKPLGSESLLLIRPTQWPPIAVTVPPGRYLSIGVGVIAEEVSMAIWGQKDRNLSVNWRLAVLLWKFIFGSIRPIKSTKWCAAVLPISSASSRLFLQLHPFILCPKMRALCVCGATSMESPTGKLGSFSAASSRFFVACHVVVLLDCSVVPSVVLVCLCSFSFWVLFSCICCWSSLKYAPVSPFLVIALLLSSVYPS